MLKKKYDKVSDGVGWRLVFYFNVFMACVSFSIILPSLWPYLEMFDADENFLAFVLFIYSFGEFIGAIAWGYIYNASSMKFSLYSCILTGLIGSLLYSIGGYFPGYGKWLVALGRLLQGLWTGGQQTVEQAYISECIDKKENLGLIANIGAAAVIGFTVGPIVGLGGRYTNFSIGWFYVDEYTSCGYFQAIITILMFVLTAYYFEEIPREYRKSLDHEEDDDEDDLIGSVSAKEILKDNRSITKYNPSEINFALVTEDEKDRLSRLKPNTNGVLVALLIFLIHFNGFAVQETITTPISTDVNHNYTNTLDYNGDFAYVLFACSGVLSIVTFMLLKQVNNLISDKVLVFISSFLGLAGYLIMIDYSPRIIEPARFIVGFCLISIAFPFGRGITLSLFAKIIGKHKAGVYMGYMLAVGAISRCVGPFWAVQALIVSPALTFGICAALFGVNIIAQWIYDNDISPHWSYFIDKYEEELHQKEGREGQNENQGKTPIVTNPFSPKAGFLPTKGKSSKKNLEKML